jgi:anti-anti-sigma factor
VRVTISVQLVEEEDSMEIAVSHEQGRVPVTVFHIQGEINVNSYEQLQAQAQAAVKAGARDVLLDLTGVTYISSAGLRALHHIFTLLRTDSPAESDSALSKGLRDGTWKSPHFKLLNPQPSVLEILKTTGYDMYLEIHHNLQEAVASF